MYSYVRLLKRVVLSHCGPVTPYGDIYIWVSIGSGNGLLSDGTKPLPEPILSSDSHPMAILQEIPQLSITKIACKLLIQNFILISQGSMSKRVNYCVYSPLFHDDVMTWNNCRITGPLWGESTGHLDARTVCIDKLIYLRKTAGITAKQYKDIHNTTTTWLR